MKRIFILVLVAISVYFLLNFLKKTIHVEERYVKNVLDNYAKDVDKICDELKLPKSYFKALIVLECSGRKPPHSRFEKGVYHKLKQVQKGQKDKYSGLTQKDLKNYSDQTLKDLATSWGALQIMGYHSIKMNVNLSHIKAGKGLRESILWCKNNYGIYLQNKEFKNAFHYHNTGRPYPKNGKPKTYDPNYVAKGMAYLKDFDTRK